MQGESVYVKLDPAITKYTSRGTELESFTETELSKTPKPQNPKTCILIMENSNKDEPIEQRVKKYLFGLFDHLVSFSIWNSILFIAVVTIELGIFLNFTYSIANRVTEVSVSLNNLSAINPSSLLEIDGIAIYVYIFFIVFGILYGALFMILVIYQIFSASPINSWVYTYSSKIYGFLAIILKNILIQPYLYISISTFYCKEYYGYECDGSMSTFLKIASSLTVICFLILIFLIILFFVDEQIHSVLPWAYCSRLYDIFKLISKILVVIANISENDQAKIFLLISISIVSFNGIVALLRQGYMTNQKVRLCLITFEIICLWVIILSILYVAFELWLGDPIVLSIIFVATGLATLSFTQNQNIFFLMSNNIETTRNINDKEIFCRIFLDRLSQKEPQNILLQNGIITIHQSECNDQLCPCHAVKLQAQGDEEESFTVNAAIGLSQKENTRNSPKKDSIFRRLSLNNIPSSQKLPGHSGKKDDALKLIIQWLIHDIEKWKETLDRPIRTHLLIAYLKRLSCSNLLTSLYEINCTEKFSSTFYEQFLIFRFKRKIEEEIEQKEKYLGMTSEIDKLISFQQTLAEMQNYMQESLEQFIGFWKELLNESPNYESVGEMSYHISSCIKKIKQNYKTLLELDQHNVYCRMLFALFLKKIVKDELEAFQVSEDINKTRNNIRLQKNYDEELGTDQKTALIVISGKDGQMGEILSVNNESVEMFHYQKEELIGHNISKMMPPVIGLHHTAMIRSYLTSHYLDESDKDSLVFPLHKLGYIVACNFMKRIMPTMSTGIKFIGFLQKINDLSDHFPFLEPKIHPDDVLMLLIDEAFDIHAFNYRTAGFFGIDLKRSSLKKYINSNEKICATCLIPELNDERFKIDLYYNDISSVKLDLSTIRQAVNHEIEIIENPLNQSTSPLQTYCKPETLFDFQSPCDDSSLSAKIGIKKLYYSINNVLNEPTLKLQLIVLFLDQIPGVPGSPLADDFNLSINWEPQKIKDENAFLDDGASVSQSSNSSYYDPQAIQRTIRSFKERIIKQERPFFVSCFIKLGVLTLLLILGCSIYEYIFSLRTINFVRTSFSNSEIVHYLQSYFLELPQIFRVIQNMYEQIEPKSSQIYSNRVSSYKKIAAEKLEKVRQYSLQIKEMDHPFSEKHKALLEIAIIKMQGESVYVKLDPAITKYTSRGTELESFTETELSKYTTESQKEKLINLCTYMITNPKGWLATVIKLSRSYFYTEVSDEFDRLEKINIIVIVIIPIGILLVMLLYIPYILYVQSNIYEIYNYVGILKEKEIKRWLDICRSSSQDVIASISDIKKIYGKENFEILIIEEEKDEERSRQEIHTEEYKTEDNLLNQENIEEREFLLYNEEIKLKRKKEMFSSMSKEKTKIYLILLLVFTSFIGIFRVIDSLYSSEIQNTCKELFDINIAFSDRSTGFLFALYYFREDMRLGTISNFSMFTAVPYLLSLVYDQEDTIIKLRPTLTGKLKPIQDFLNIADSSKLCSEFLADDATCSTIYGGIMELGYKESILAILIYMHKYFTLFSILEGSSRTVLGLFQFQEICLVMIFDLRTKYEAKAFDIIFKKIFEIEENWSSSMKTTLDIKFTIYFILLVFLFLSLWKKMAEKMRLDIMKALAILNVLPTNYLRAKPEFIKIIGQSSLIA